LSSGVGSLITSPVGPITFPLPSVLSPAERTDTIHDTQGNEIEFTDNGNTQPEPTADVPEVSSEPAAEVGGDENI